MSRVLQGRLSTRDWPTKGIIDNAPWRALDESLVAGARQRIGTLLTALTQRKNPFEAETEDKLVYPVLRELGWGNLSVRQRMDVNLTAKQLATRQAINQKLLDAVARRGLS